MHPHTLCTEINYAHLLSDQNKVDEAAPLFLEALEGRRLALGDEHPDTLAMIRIYWNLQKDQGKLQELVAQGEATLSSRRRSSEQAASQIAAHNPS